MPETIFPTKVPADAIQRGHLQTLFSSPGFSLLKEMIAARCIEAQVEAMNMRLYPKNPVAVGGADEKEFEARLLNGCLEYLDFFSGSDQEWHTVKLEHRR